MQHACAMSMHTAFYCNSADLQYCKLLLLPLQMLLSCKQLTVFICKLTLAREGRRRGMNSLVQGMLQNALQLRKLAQGILPVSLSSGLCAQGRRLEGDVCLLSSDSNPSARLLGC